MAKIGIELLNNSETTMEEVVQLLCFVFGHRHADAFELMLAVHRNGQAVVALVEEGELGAFTERLDATNARLGSSLSYRTVPDATGATKLEALLSDLPDDATWEEMVRSDRAWSWTLSIAMLAVVLGLGILAYLRLT